MSSGVELCTRRRKQLSAVLNPVCIYLILRLSFLIFEFLYGTIKGALPANEKH